MAALFAACHGCLCEQFWRTVRRLGCNSPETGGRPRGDPEVGTRSPTDQRPAEEEKEAPQEAPPQKEAAPQKDRNESECLKFQRRIEIVGPESDDGFEGGQIDVASAP
jgi:hypothetical protein